VVEIDGQILYINYNMPSSVGSVSDVDVPPLTVIDIPEMGQTRLEKLYKPRLIEAISVHQPPRVRQDPRRR
jgi:hypothetical protein